MTGEQILDEVAAFIKRYVVLPSDDALVAVVLWTMHAHCLEAAESTPYLSVQSPEKRSGKTRLLEVLELLVPRALRASAASESALFRSIAEDPPPTLLFDEIDAVFTRPRAETEGLRGVLNAGHRRGSVVIRSVIKGNSVEVERLPVFCAKVLAGIGTPPDTIGDRSIVIAMKRRAPGERAEKFRYRTVVITGEQLSNRVAAWCEKIVPSLSENPPVPDELDDRAADGWEPLLAIADAAAGKWPVMARKAAIALSAGRNDDDDVPLGNRLLTDLRAIFDARVADKMSSQALCAALAEMETAPWGDLHGKPITQRSLSRMLHPYGIRPKSIRVADASTAKGYDRRQFEDSWGRYS